MTKTGPRKIATNRKHGFQKGHAWYQRKDSTSRSVNELPFRYLRLQHCLLEDIAGASVQMLDEDGIPQYNVRVLRPRKDTRSALESAAMVQNGNELDSYRIVHLEKVQEMYIDALKQHESVSPACDGSLRFDQDGEVQHGLAWQETLKCSKCQFRSEKCKLYKEIDTGKRGKKAADINLSVHVGTSHTPISCTGLNKIIVSMNIPPPSRRHLQRNSNKVADILVQENTQHMQGICQNLQEINVLKGLSPDAPHDLEVDCRYNNPVYSAVGRSPFQAGTQVTQVVCEQTTSRKQIVCLTNKSKLCQTARMWEHRTGREVTCPDHPGECSANLPVDATIGKCNCK